MGINSDIMNILKSIRPVQKSGGSLRVVIPSLIVKHLGLKEGDAVYFNPIEKGAAKMVKVSSENIEEVILQEIERRQRIKKLIERVPEELSVGNISILEELEKIRKELRNIITLLKKFAEDRGLYFTDEDSYLADIVFELESEREEEFQEILDYVKALRERREKITKALRNIEKWLDEGKLAEKTARDISEKLKGELELIDRRIKILRKVIE